MITTWVYALASVIAVSLMSFIGLLVLALRVRIVKRAVLVLVALSAGALFGDVFFHLLPEIFESDSPTTLSSVLILAGIIIFLVLEKFLRWGHSHEVDVCPEPEHHEIKPFGRINLTADALHNLIDGLAIGASFLVGPRIGFATALAVILHEIPQEVGDFGILLHAGYTKWRALFYNLLSALVAVLGTIVVLLLGERVATITGFLLPIATGGFIYIAGSDLVPELHKTVDTKKSLFQLGAFLVGIAAMLALLFLE